MYIEYFGLKEKPFSIAPNPQYLYMSDRHREALAHLLYSVEGDGGFVLLTGEVGTGKTTVCRCLLEQLPEEIETAFILNPKLSALELLAATCDDLNIDYPENCSLKVLIDRLNEHLLDAHAHGRKTLLIIDEAQNLSIDVLEQLRLLTNLETNTDKLLRIVLLGQPELQTMLNRSELRQLSQRITARFHLDALRREEVGAYIRHRLSVANGKGQLFSEASINHISKLSKGIPRLINLICDRCLLGLYAQSGLQVDLATVKQAAAEIFGGKPGNKLKIALFVAAAAVAASAAAIAWNLRPLAAEDDAVIQAAPQLVELSFQVPQKEHETAVSSIPEVALAEQPIIFDDLKSIVETRQSSRAESFQVMFERWGNTYEGNGDPCNFAPAVGLSCLQKTGSLRDLLYMNRPALLQLTGELSVVLDDFRDNEAVLVLDGEAFTISSNQLFEFWDGNYTILWRIPPGYTSPSRLGDSGESVAWLHKNLLAIQGQDDASALESDIFDSKLDALVKQFQISSGLQPDGIVGPRTWIQINSQTNLGIPFLNSS